MQTRFAGYLEETDMKRVFSFGSEAPQPNLINHMRVSGECFMRRTTYPLQPRLSAPEE
jgi:hypothetical protein